MHIQNGKFLFGQQVHSHATMLVNTETNFSINSYKNVSVRTVQKEILYENIQYSESIDVKKEKFEVTS